MKRLEGLRSVQPDNRPYDPATSPLKLWFRNLEAYMKNRVRDLLTKQDKKVAQVLEAGGQRDDDVGGPRVEAKNLREIKEHRRPAPRQKPSETVRRLPGLVSLLIGGATLLKISKGIHDAPLHRRGQQRLLIVLAMQVDECAAQFLQSMQRAHRSIQIDPVSSGPGDHPPYAQL